MTRGAAGWRRGGRAAQPLTPSRDPRARPFRLLRGGECLYFLDSLFCLRVWREGEVPVFRLGVTCHGDAYSIPHWDCEGVLALPPPG